MASGSKFFGAGLAQGLGQSIGQLPALLLAMQEMQAKEEDRKLQNQVLELKVKQMKAGEKMQEIQGQMLQRFLTSGGLDMLAGGGGGGEAAPQDPALGEFAESQGLAPSLFPDAGQGGGAPAGGQQFVPKPSFRMGPTGPSFGMSFEPRKGQLAELPQQGGPPVTVLLDPFSGNVIKNYGPIPTTQTRQAIELGELTGRDPSEILEMQFLTPQTREEVAIGGLAGAQERAISRRASEKAQTAKMQTRARLEAEREPVMGLLGKLEKTLGGIKLPKTGTERLSAAPRLLGESVLQSNENLVLFNTLKEGFLAAVVRAAGERGTLTDQDISRARALMPNVMPGPGILPDTESVAKAKLKQLRSLLGDFSEKDPLLAEELQAVEATVAAQKRRGARLAEPSKSKARFRYEPGKGLIPLE